MAAVIYVREWRRCCRCCRGNPDVSAMLTQIYEVSSPEEADAMSAMAIDHIGILVGDGSYPREQSLATAPAIISAVRTPSKVSALFLSSNLSLIETSLL